MHAPHAMAYALHVIKHASIALHASFQLTTYFNGNMHAPFKMAHAFKRLVILVNNLKSWLLWKYI